ncbi:MAG: RNA polymerase sigma factor, partial [Bacteroidota bacterium]
MTRRNTNIVSSPALLPGLAAGGGRVAGSSSLAQNYSLSTPDPQLVQASVRGDRSAQKALYQTLLPYLRAVAIRYLKDESYQKDALQESFVKLFRSLGRYDPAKAPLKAWAARIVINTCLNFNQRIIEQRT